MKKYFPKFVLASFLLLSPLSAVAQLTSGELAGTVKDATGASIPNAAVVVTNEATNVSTKITTNSSGEYHVSNLPAGKYDVAVTASGFTASKLNGVLIDTGKISTSNIALQVGASTSVEVSAEAGVVLDTTSTNLTTTFSNEELSNLPTASFGTYGVLNTSLLSPGVASSGGLGLGIGPSVGGQRPRNNNFTVEGIDNNNKSITGPLVYIPNDAVDNFTLITNQFAPEFGHSSGGQFNTTVVSGTNKFHGKLYEYFQNRNLNADLVTGGQKIPNPRFDNNRYGGQLGGPIIKDKLFFFVNFERTTTGQNDSYFLCTPTAAGLSTLNSVAAGYGFSSTNLAIYNQYTPAGTGGPNGGIDATKDAACGNSPTGAQYLTVNNAAGTASTQIPLGNYQVNAPYFENFDALTTSVDYNISSADSLRLRYMYNTEGTTDFAAQLPAFWTTEPFKWHLFTLSEYHTFTPNLTNEFRVGFNRYANPIGAGNFNFPGLDQFPNLYFYDQGFLDYGPDDNAPQSTIQNLYEVTDNISYVKGKHTIKIGFDGRKYISPQTFTQRARGDYEWNNLGSYLLDLAPDAFGQRSTGNQTYYGDQTAFYGYGNDTWRITPSLTLNVGLRYEFTSVPVGERSQALNSAASVPGLITFGAPQPTYTSFAPRVGINYSPDSKTSIRAGYGLAYDVLFDNLGTLSFPPQYSTTQNIGTCPPLPPGVTTQPAANLPCAGSPNFLKNGGLPPGNGSGVTVYPNTPDGLAQQRADTAAYIPNQVTPYAETYNLTIQRTIGSAWTAEIGYIGTRGIHLPTQIQLNIQAPVTASNQLGTAVNGSTQLTRPGAASSNLAYLNGLSNILPAYQSAGFTSTITSYQPWSGSNYNGLVANLTRRYQNGLQVNLSYTWSKTMDNATAEVFSTVLTPRRPQDSQNLNADYSRSALDRTHRVTLEMLYDLPFYKHSSNFFKKNLVGNWQVTPIYTYESPEYATPLSGVNSNLNGDSGAAIDRPLINPNGVKGTGSGVIPIVNVAGASSCINDPNDPNSAVTTTHAIANAGGGGGAVYSACAYNIIGYSAGSVTGSVFNPSNAQFVEAGSGTLPTAARNSLPIRPINNFDLAVYKRFSVHEHYGLEFGAQAFNVLNHAQYIPGSVDNVNYESYTANYNFQTVSNAFFNRPDKVFSNNPRTMQLTGKITF